MTIVHAKYIPNLTYMLGWHKVGMNRVSPLTLFSALLESARSPDVNSWQSTSLSRVNVRKL